MECSAVPTRLQYANGECVVVCSCLCGYGCWQVVEETKVPMLCLDVANGYSEHFVDFVRRVREKFPGHTIIAGNVVTGTYT